LKGGWRTPEQSLPSSEGRKDIYYHFSNRDKWQSDFLNYQDAKELHNLAVSRLNYVYRESSFQYMQADNSNAKFGFLHLMLDATAKLVEVSKVSELEILEQEVDFIKKALGEKR
jgi:hypothetical protein